MALLVGFPHQRSHPVPAPDRHRGFVHHDGKVLPQLFADAARGRLQVFQIGSPLGSRRRSHRDEDHLRLGDRLRVIRGELEIAARLRHQFRQVRLVKRNPAVFEHLDFAGVWIGASYFVPQKRKTRAGGQTDIAGT